MIIHTLFTQAEFTGKQVTVFATSATSHLATTLAEMKKLIETAGGTLVEE